MARACSESSDTKKLRSRESDPNMLPRGGKIGLELQAPVFSSDSDSNLGTDTCSKGISAADDADVKLTLLDIEVEGCIGLSFFTVASEGLVSTAATKSGQEI